MTGSHEVTHLRDFVWTPIDIDGLAGEPVFLQNRREVSKTEISLVLEPHEHDGS